MIVNPNLTNENSQLHRKGSEQSMKNYGQPEKDMGNHESGVL